MNKNTLSYKCNDEYYVYLRNSLSKILKTNIERSMDLYKYNKIMILCIGTARLLYDSYGPIVGSGLMKAKFNSNITIFGTTKKSLNALNIESFLNNYKEKLDESLVIVIDSTISMFDDVGTVIFYDDGIYPGEALNKNLPKIGDFSICGVISNDEDSIICNDIYEFIKMVYTPRDINTYIKMCDLTINSLFLALDSKKKYSEENFEYTKKLVMKSDNYMKNILDNTY